MIFFKCCIGPIGVLRIATAVPGSIRHRPKLGQGQGSRGGGKGGNCPPPPTFSLNGMDRPLCLCPPKFWQSLGISTLLPPPPPPQEKNRSRAPDLGLGLAYKFFSKTILSVTVRAFLKANIKSIMVSSCERWLPKCASRPNFGKGLDGYSGGYSPPPPPSCETQKARSL